MGIEPSWLTVVLFILIFAMPIGVPIIIGLYKHYTENQTTYVVDVLIIQDGTEDSHVVTEDGNPINEK